MSINTTVDGVEGYIRKAKEQLADVRMAGETGRELSLVMTKLDEAELWIRAYREKKEAGSHEGRKPYILRQEAGSDEAR